jgi:hypothetical protein
VIIVLATLAVLFSRDVRTITRKEQTSPEHLVPVTDLAEAALETD